MSSLKNELRVLKRKSRKESTRLVEIYDKYQDEYVYERRFHSDAFRIHYLASIVGHVPMKKESELLRQVMSKSGLSEKEIRENKKYRVLLSNAAKLEPKKITDNQQRFIKICRNVMKELNLPIWNPLVKKEIQSKIKGFEYFSKYIVEEYMRISALKKQK